MNQAGAQITRRRLVQAAGSLALGGPALLTLTPAAATPASMQAAIAHIVGDARITPGRVTLDIPPLVENPNTVSCSVSVDSPMTPHDYVKAIHVFTEKNPQPNVISARLSWRAGKAMVSTRIRLADTQTVTAIAQMSDGSFWSHAVGVIVTLGACLEDS